MTSLPSSVPLMTRAEAQRCVERINSNISGIRTDLVLLNEQEGYKALGYGTFRECLATEFTHSASYLYRQLAAGKLEQVLELPIGDTRESHMRPLLTILDNDADREAAYGMAVSISDTPTAEQFALWAKWVYVRQNGAEPIWHAMEDGLISTVTAYDIAKIVETQPPELAAVCMHVRDVSMIPILHRLFTESSDTWSEIYVTGHIPGYEEQVPLHEATRSHLLAWLDIASTEHRAVSIAQNKEKWDMVKQCVEVIIEEARRISEDYPALRTALEEYDEITKGR